MNKKRVLQCFFWLLTLCASGMILWKFLGSQEQPMEVKILFVCSTFVICAVLYRWIRKRAEDEFLKRWTAEAIEWSDTGISAVILAFVIMSFILQAFKIPSSSMEPTLQIGDHLFVNKFIYGTQLPFTLKRLWKLKEVKRYDIVVFLCPSTALSIEERKLNVKKDFIKRAIGLPGETVEIRNKVLYINGVKEEDSHAYFKDPLVYPKPPLWKSQGDYQQGWERGDFASPYLPGGAVRDNFGPIQVPQGYYFVLGDNRDGSFDSRFWGPLPEKYLKGRAWRVYWPVRRFGRIR